MGDFKEGEFEPQHVAISDLGQAELDAAEKAAAEEKSAAGTPDQESAKAGDEKDAGQGGKPTAGGEAQDQEQETAETDDAKPGDEAGEEGDKDKAGEEKTDLEQTEEQKAQSKSARKRQRQKERERELASSRDRALREAEEERQKREDVERELAKFRGESGSDRPNRYDFNTDDEFNEALDAWMDKEADRRAAAKANSGQEDQRPTAQQVIRADRARAVAAAGEEMFDDFKQVASNPNVPWTEPMLDEVLELDPEDAARVTHHLSTHDDEANRLANLNGSALAREVGRITARLDAEAQANTAKPPAPGASQSPPDKSGAPEPIKPVPGADAQVTDEDNLPIEDWMERQWKREGRIKSG